MFGLLPGCTDCTVKIEKPRKGDSIYTVARRGATEKLVLDRTVHSDAVLVVVLCEKG